MSRYKKTILALLGGVVAWGLTASADSKYDQTEFWGLGAALLTAGGVYQVQNTPPKGRRRRDDTSEAKPAA